MVILYVCDFLFGSYEDINADSSQNIYEKLVTLFTAAIYFFTSIGFFVYGYFVYQFFFYF